MCALLTIETGLGDPRVCGLRPDQRITLGRHQNNSIVLHDEHASRHHAEVFHENGQWRIRDFGALNRTRVNGDVVEEQAVLQSGYLISIGKTSLRFTVEDALNGASAKP